MSSTLLRTVVFVGIVATLAVNVVAPRLGVAPAKSPPTAPVPAGPRLIPPPPGMR